MNAAGRGVRRQDSINSCMEMVASFILAARSLVPFSRPVLSPLRGCFSFPDPDPGKRSSARPIHHMASLCASLRVLDLGMLDFRILSH